MSPIKQRNPREILATALSKYIQVSLGRPLKLTKLQITPDIIVGKFTSESDKFIFSAVFAGKDSDRLEVLYKPVQLAERKDSLDDERYDRNAGKRKPRRAKPKCVNSVPCGDTCIEIGDVCHVGEGNPFNTPVIARKMKELATEASEGKPDAFTAMTIRELKEEARLAGIYRYGELDSNKLRQTLRQVNTDPSTQTRLRKTLNRKNQRESAIRKVLPKDPGKAYKEFKRISKLAGINPELAAISAAALLIGISRNQFDSARDRYKNSLPNSAKVAMDRARSVDTVSTAKKNLLFAVGGFEQAGGSAKDISSMLKPQGSGVEEKWFRKANEIVEVTHSSMSGMRPIGKKNGILYTGQIFSGGLSRSLTQLVRGQNDAAIDLASRFYANGVRNPGKGLNVVTHGAGAVNVRAAGEILRRMNPGGKGGPRGSEIFSRLNVVNLGGPSFGFTNDKAWDMVPFRTLTSGKDLSSILPKKFPEWIDSVKGGTVKDYLQNSEVRERLRESFGFYGSSLGAIGKKKARSQQIISDLTEAANLVHPAAGRALNTTLSIVDKFRDRPATAAALSTIAISGTTAFAYGQAKKKYKANLADGARQARDYAISHPPNTKAVRSQVVIAVGGGDTTGKELRDQIAKNPSLSRDEASQFKSGHFVEVNPNQGAQKTPEGVQPGTFAWAAHNVKNAYGATLGKLNNLGKRPEAVELAGQMYAQATKEYVNENKTTGRKELVRLPVNVVAYGDGGLVAREALDILANIKGSAGLPSGKELLEGKAPQLRVVTIGTPSFGLSPGDQPETNVMATSDIWAKTPLTLGRGKTATVSGVDNPSSEGYTASPNVGAVIRPALQLKVGETSRRSVKVARAGVNVGGEQRSARAQVIESYPTFLQKPEDRPDWRGLNSSRRATLARKYKEEMDKISRRYKDEFEILKSTYVGRTPPEPIYKLAARLAIDKQRKIWEENGDTDLTKWPQNGRGVRTDSAAFWAGYYGLRVDRAPKIPKPGGQTPGNQSAGGQNRNSKLQKKQITNKSGEKQTVWVDPNKEKPGSNAQSVVKQGVEVAKQAIGDKVADTQAAAKTAEMVQSYARKNFSQGSKNPEFDKELLGHAAKAMTTGDLPSRPQIVSLMSRSAQNFLADPIGEVNRGFEREAIAREAFKARFGEDAPTKAQVAKQAIKSGGKAVKNVIIDPETVVLAGGVAGGMIGGAVAGPAGALAGDLVGGLAARKITEFGGKVKKELDRINESAPEFEKDMGKLQKLASATNGALNQLKTPEVQIEMEDNLIGDSSGWAIGNAVGKAANAIAPMTGNLLSPAGIAGVSLSGGTAALAVPLIVRPIVRQAHDNVRKGMNPAEATTAAITHFMGSGARREEAIRRKFKEKVQEAHGVVGERIKEKAQEVVTEKIKTQATKAGASAISGAINHKTRNVESDKTKKRELVND